MLRRFGTLLAFQPILLGLIFLTRHIWIEGGVTIGTGVVVILFVEAYTTWKMRLPGRRSLSSSTKESLDMFDDVAKYPQQAVPAVEESNNSSTGAQSGHRARGSMASVLDMMSQTLAVTPSHSQGPVPLRKFGDFPYKLHVDSFLCA
jgi:calcium permeable stress-gated cation channel